MEIVADKAGESEGIQLNAQQSEFKVGIFVKGLNGATFEVAIEYSPNKADWFVLDDMGSITGDHAGNVFFPVERVRMNVKSLSGGKVKFIVTQGA